MSLHQAEAIAGILGGRKTFGAKPKNIEELRKLILEGFPVSTLNFLADRMAMSFTELAEPLHIPARTLYRRKSSANRLTAVESDSLFRIARIIAHAESVFGNKKSASNWLRSEVPSLGGQRPLDILDTDAGALEVDDLLGRIEHGVF
jgi:putative toxin-antitoxin system antitoxin component (TIGR02293 family)